MGTDFTVVAIIAAYNEGDVIGAVLRDLIGQDVRAYLIDHCSTDDTVARAEAYLGHGLLGIERFPGEDSGEAGTADRFSWEAILKRKELLAADLAADWFIHHDADELRESPWAHLNLREAIRAVDGLGYNAIDFELLNFWPTHDGFHPDQDLRAAFQFYSLGDPWDKVQIKCWKKTADRVDLASSGGHEAIFPNRRVFPLRFLLRHYPIRGQAHGERKVFQERQSRFVETERSRGWHVQYDAIQRGQSFLRDPATMNRYDPEAVRWGLILRHRDVSELEEALTAERLAREATVRDLEKIQDELAGERRSREAISRDVETLKGELVTRAAEVRELQARIVELHGELERDRQERDQVAAELQARIVELQSDLERGRRERDGFATELSATRRTVEAICATRSWRWTAPLRAAFRFLGGR